MSKEYKFKYFCNDWDAPIKASAKSDNIYSYECGLLNLRDAIDEELNASAVMANGQIAVRRTNNEREGDYRGNQGRHRK
mgnify:CR=1 FL=1